MQLADEGRRELIYWLLGGTVVVGVGLLVLTGFIFAPLIRATAAPPPAEAKLELPPYDWQAWHALPVMHHGRVKPFESAANEVVLDLTGRSHFAGLDPVGLVLTWRLGGGQAAGSSNINWENYPFILCDHQGLRQLLYNDLVDRRQQAGEPAPKPGWVSGKYVAPSDLYESPNFIRLCSEDDQLRREYGEKAQHAMSPEQRKAEEVEERLINYFGITQRLPEKLPQELRTQEVPPDPFHFVALDRVKGGGWFSVGQLKDIQNHPEKWHDEMRKRVAETPQRYVPPDCQAELEQFQAHLKDGTLEPALEELSRQRARLNEERIGEFRSRHPEKEPVELKAVDGDPILADLVPDEAARIYKLITTRGDAHVISPDALARELGDIFADRLKNSLDGIRQQMAGLKGVRYRADDPRFRMVHLNYLETRFPDIYRQSQAWQKYPEAEAGRVLAAYDSLRTAYLSANADSFGPADAQRFAEAGQGFATSVREVSQQFDDYPGVPTLGLELTFNHARPFMWGWIIMLAAVLLFIASLALRSRILYVAAFAAYLGSLAFLVFGFYTRISISGRPPVSDMYETVIWVSFMSAVFALVLELIYRRKYIGLAGALAATLGLILADNTILDPTLKPLQPVLRSNFWLTVHVLTIVSSYAGGTLAWGLGNLALAFMAFGTPRRDLLKTLSQYTYRAMQIAVLLLAVGTFLGAWWAADSWGRYWGWDPKEVWALIALVAYVIPLHMRYIGWVKDFGLAVSAVLCYAVIVMSWYGVNFVLGAGLHSYGFGGGGPWWVFWAGLINLEWVLITSILYLRKLPAVAPVKAPLPEQFELRESPAETHVQAGAS
jgi:ABC-type transport system involved in cytochrome c biogenesis permease subunit